LIDIKHGIDAVPRSIFDGNQGFLRRKNALQRSR